MGGSENNQLCATWCQAQEVRLVEGVVEEAASFFHLIVVDVAHQGAFAAVADLFVVDLASLQSEIKASF